MHMCVRNGIYPTIRMRYVKGKNKEQTNNAMGKSSMIPVHRDRALKGVTRHSFVGDGSIDVFSGELGSDGLLKPKYPPGALITPLANAAAALLPAGGRTLNGAGVSGRLAKGGRETPCPPLGVGGALLFKEICARMRWPAANADMRDSSPAMTDAAMRRASLRALWPGDVEFAPRIPSISKTAPCGARTVPPPTVPTSMEGIEQVISRSSPPFVLKQCQWYERKESKRILTVP